MKCVPCDLYHPARFDKCVSCGGPLVPGAVGFSEAEVGVSGAPPMATSQSEAPLATPNWSPFKAGAPRSEPPKQQGERPRARDFSAYDLPSYSPPQAETVVETANQKPRQAPRQKPERNISENPVQNENEEEQFQYVPPVRRARTTGRFAAQEPVRKPRGPLVLKITLIVLSVLLLAGVLVFFLTKKPEHEILYRQAEKELANGQYAFAVSSLKKAIEHKPDEGKLYLALARAYVGIDQVDQAMAAIKDAKKAGARLQDEPVLTSELANYYRQRNSYGKAIELLKPLAEENAPGKKAELADLEGSYGDDALRSGKPDLALKCWEEVRDLHEGSRFTEADARLSTIYTKLANIAYENKKDDDALKYLAKLNLIAQNSKNYSLAADVYEREGKLDLAIEQIREATKVSGHDQNLDRRLVSLLSRRGKELLDEGQADSGYAYLQQAKQLDPKGAVPLVTVKNLSVTIDGATHMPRITGEVWNPTEISIGSLVLKAEVFDLGKSEALWSKENKIVDEFVPPLAPKQSRTFDIVSEVPVKPGEDEFRVYLDGALYKSYPIGKKEGDLDSSSPPPKVVKDSMPVKATVSSTLPKPAPSIDSTTTSLPKILPPAESQSQSANITQAPGRNGSAEERTMRDLEF